MWLTHVEPLPLLASSANLARGIRVTLTGADGLVAADVCASKGDICSARCLVRDTSRAAGRARALFMFSMRTPTRRAKVERGGNADHTALHLKTIGCSSTLSAHPCARQRGYNSSFSTSRCTPSKQASSPLRMVVTVGALGRPLLSDLGTSASGGAWLHAGGCSTGHPAQETPPSVET